MDQQPPASLPIQEHPEHGATSEPVPARPSGEGLNHLLISGPVVLALATGVEWMIWMWRVFWQRKVGQTELDRYTSLVRPMFQADNDKPIYLGFSALTVILAAAVYFLWRHRLRSATAEDRYRVTASALAHFPVAAIVIFLPMLLIGAVQWNFVAGVLGLGGLILLNKIARDSLPPEMAWPKPPPVWRWGAGVWLAGLLIVGLVYVPYPAVVSGFNYRLEQYTHWNAYAMFPALAWRLGGKLISDYYVQYGVGWPLVLAGLSHFTPLSYGLAIRVAAIWACVYYVILFYFLQTLLRRTSWAFAGLALALYVQCFGGMVGTHKWCLPSGTVLRYSTDVIFFLICLWHARTGRAWLGVPMGALVGLAILFGIDAGLYLVVCLLFYVAVAWRLPSCRSGWNGTLFLAAGAIPALALTALAGLWIASRGGVFHASFWSQWSESLVEYGGGISDLPIAKTFFEDDYRETYFLLAAILVCYLGAILWMVERLWRRAGTPEELITGLVALYGMATLLLFIGRSDPVYLRNVSVPFCIVLARWVFGLYEFIAREFPAIVVRERQAAARAVLGVVPWVCAAALAIALCLTDDFADYPGLLQVAAGNRWTDRQAAEADYLFPAAHDAPLIPEREQEVAVYRREVADFRAVADALRDLKRRGKTVAILGMHDTDYLVAADMRPYFRYSPVLQTLLTKRQVQSIEQVLIDRPPDYVLYPPESPLTLFRVTADDVYLSIRGVIQKHFHLERRIGGFDVYRR